MNSIIARAYSKKNGTAVLEPFRKSNYRPINVDGFPVEGKPIIRGDRLTDIQLGKLLFQTMSIRKRFRHCQSVPHITSGDRE